VNNLPLLQELKTNNGNKWSILQDEIRRVSRNIFKRLRSLLSNRNTSMEEVQFNCRGETGSRLPANAGFVCHRAAK
jgi:hypothetical protein